MLVRAILVLLAIERTELAAERADVGVVQVAINVVVRDVAVLAAADEVGQRAHRPDVWRLVQQQPILARESLPRSHLVGNRLQARIEPRTRAGGRDTRPRNSCGWGSRWGCDWGHVISTIDATGTS